MQNIVLSNGIQIPAGTLICANAVGTHYNDATYPNPDVFEPFRFSSMRKEGHGMRHQYTNTSVDFIAFGIGAAAWYVLRYYPRLTLTDGLLDSPGRFFASSELKSILAYVVLNYDLKLHEGATRPPNIWFGRVIMPALDGKVLFRKRQNVDM